MHRLLVAALLAAGLLAALVAVPGSGQDRPDDNSPQDRRNNRPDWRDMGDADGFWVHRGTAATEGFDDARPRVVRMYARFNGGNGLGRYQRDLEASIPGIREDAFDVLNSADELDAFRERIGRPDLFADQDIDFDAEMIVTVIGRMGPERDLRVHRALETPEEIQITVTIWQRGGNRPVLGVGGGQIAVGRARELDIDGGVRIDTVGEGSAAESGGIQPGDIIWKINEDPVASLDALVAFLGTTRGGQTITVHVIRNDAKLALEVTMRRPARVTPWYALRLPRIDKPVIIFRHDAAFMGAEGLTDLTPGLHREVITHDLPYAVYVPEGVGENGPAPVAVVLHGSTINGNRFIDRWAPLADHYGFVVLAVSNRNGWYWTEHYDYGAIFEAIDRISARVPLDRSNIFVGGGSAGGHTSYHIALNHHETFKGWFALCGRLNPGIEDDIVARANGKPVFIMSGDSDDLVSITAVRRSRDTLRAAGANVTYREIAGGGHSAPNQPENLRHCWDWLYEQAYGRPAPGMPIDVYENDDDE